MKFIEITRLIDGVVYKQLVNIEDIVTVKQGKIITLICTRDGNTIETNMLYSKVIALLKQATEALE